MNVNSTMVTRNLWRKSGNPPFFDSDVQLLNAGHRDHLAAFDERIECHTPQLPR